MSADLALVIALGVATILVIAFLSLAFTEESRRSRRIRRSDRARLRKLRAVIREAEEKH